MTAPTHRRVRDVWGTRLNVQCNYWANTVVLVVWDDWGGFYDDVPPPDCSGSTCTGYSNNTGGQYVYGFRVPLLVVSAYTQQVTTSGGYISGSCISGTCQNKAPFIHDFGSILNFTETVFGLGEISPSYHYADFLAPDGPNGPCGPVTCPYSLADFFAFTKPARTYTPIAAPLSQDCFTGAALCFTTYGLDPDDDAKEDQD